MKKLEFKKIRIKKLVPKLVILVLIAIVVFLFVKKPSQESKAQEVMTSQAVIGNVESIISGTGTLCPANQYDVKSLVKGTVLKAPLEEGDMVKKGELLFQISTNDIENSLKSAKLNVEKAQLSYQDIQDRIEELKLNAKVSGYIKKLYVKEGDSIQQGTTIADVYNDGVMYLDVLFPAFEVKKSWIGKKASIILDATEDSIQGEVTDISSMEETMEGGILVKRITIRVKNEGGICAGNTAVAVIDDISSNNIGTFRAETETTVVAAAEGKIESLNIKEGQWLQKGDIVLELSSKSLESQLTNAELSMKEAKLSLETQENQIELYTIEAPISGQVITKNKKQGDTIDPATDAQTSPMTIIYDMSYLKLQMNIDEIQISKVKEGQSVSITTEAFPEDTYYGVIDNISLNGNTNNGVTSYPVTIKVENYGKLLPGMNVTSKIHIEKAENVLTIPSSALQRDNVVYVKSEDPVTDDDPAIPAGFKPVTVKIGINDGTNAEVKEGLKEGDTVYIPFDNTVTLPDNMYYY